MTKRKRDSDLNDSASAGPPSSSNASTRSVSRKTIPQSSPASSSCSSAPAKRVSPSVIQSLIKARAALAEKRRVQKGRVMAEMKRKEALAEFASKKAAALLNFPLPTHWEKDFNGDYIMLLELDKSNPLHVEEWNKFNIAGCYARRRETDGSESIVSVVLSKLWRIQNATLYRQYEVAKSELQLKSVDFRADVVAFHGSRAVDPLLLAAIGLDGTFGVAAPGHIWVSKRAAYSICSFAHLTADNYQVLAVHANVLPKESAYVNTVLRESNVLRTIPVSFIIVILILCQRIRSFVTGDEFYVVSENARTLPTHLLEFAVSK